MGRATMAPSTTVARCLVAWTPRMALCGGLMMGVESMEPKTPPLVTVKVPPLISSSVSAPVCARAPKSAMADSMAAKDMDSALRKTGVTSPRGVPTATAMSQ